MLDAAFGADRHGRTAYRLREGVTALEACSFALVEDSALVGSVQSWPLLLSPSAGRAEPLVLLGPIAVRPDRQGSGIGQRLTRAALDAIDARGSTATVLIGDPDYYARFFRFSAASTGGWSLPGPVERHRLLARLTGGRTLPVEGVIGPDLRGAPPAP